MTDNKSHCEASRFRSRQSLAALLITLATGGASGAGELTATEEEPRGSYHDLGGLGQQQAEAANDRQWSRRRASGRVVVTIATLSLLVQVVNAGLIFTKANIYLQPIFFGLIIFAAVFVDSQRARLLSRLAARRPARP